MVEHTPGPWSIITDDDCPIEISVDGSDADSGQVVSQWVVVESETHAGFLAAVIDMNYPNSFDDDTLNANARLIAAAPDGLNFAEAFIALVDRSDLDDLDFGRGLHASGLIEQARAYAAKARGAL